MVDGKNFVKNAAFYVLELMLDTILRDLLCAGDGGISGPSNVLQGMDKEIVFEHGILFNDDISNMEAEADPSLRDIKIDGEP